MTGYRMTPSDEFRLWKHAKDYAAQYDTNLADDYADWYTEQHRHAPLNYAPMHGDVYGQWKHRKQS
jgi:hypothetical protein